PQGRALRSGPDRLDLERRTRDLEHSRSQVELGRRRASSHRRSPDRSPGEDAVAHGHRRGRLVGRRERRGHRGGRARCRSRRLARATRVAGTTPRAGRLGCVCRRLAAGGGMTLVLAAGNGKVLWYLTRATGVVSLLLLTAVLLLGIASSIRWRSDRWPRFVVADLHRNLTLLSIFFVVIHVVTSVADGFAPIRLVDA